jgi:hypothetical protein
MKRNIIMNFQLLELNFFKFIEGLISYNILNDDNWVFLPKNDDEIRKR